MDKIEFQKTLNSTQEELPAEVARRIRTRSEQAFWEFQQWLKDPIVDEETERLVQSVSSLGYGELVFKKMQELAARTVDATPVALHIPEFRRFAEYFGAIPTRDSGLQETRTYEDRHEPIILPGEESYF